MRRIGPLVCVLTVSVLGLTSWAGEATNSRHAAPKRAIEVTNHESGGTVRYPVVLIRGVLRDGTASSILVVNRSSNRDTREMRGLAHDGHFRALAELVPGPNRLMLKVGEDETMLEIAYRPQTNPHVVRVVYLTDSSGNTGFQTLDEDDPQNFRGKLGTAMKLMQTFTAERMHDLGYGRRTFNMELDEDGQVVVHVLKGDHPAAHYRRLKGGQLYDCAARLVRDKLPNTKAKNLAIPAFTRFDPKTQKALAHTALGGGNLAFFGDGDLFAWPDRLADVQGAFMNARQVDPKLVFSDSVGRHTLWAIASTTIGAALHELGHTFGLPHSSDPHDIMSRGFDRLNRVFTLIEPPHARRGEAYKFGDDQVARWTPTNAVALRASRWFALDARPYDDQNLTHLALDEQAACLRVRSGHGIAAVVFRVGDRTVDHFPIRAGERPKQVDLPLAWLGRRLATDDFSLRVIDGHGLSKGVQMNELLPIPFVRAWRLSPTTLPWRDSRAFVDMTPERLQSIETAALSRPLVTSPSRFLDFIPRFRQGPQTNVADYVARVIRVGRPRKVKVLSGSDDALRLWLNREVVQEALFLRGAQADQDSTLVELRPGDNTLVAEVSQATGGWRLYLRLEGPDGTPLDLTDDGRLAAASAKAVERVRSALRGPYLRSWQFAKVTHPWTDKSGFVPMAPTVLQTIAESAVGAPLLRSEGRFVDFKPRFPAKKQSNVAGYVLRTIRTDRTRRVKLFTGSDDALRVWLNGKLVASVLALRGVSPDSEATTIELRPGANKLIAEVSQAGGDWALCARLEDMEGRDLRLADDGALTTAMTKPRDAMVFPVVSDPKPLTPLMERELRGCFDFFWNEWVSDPESPTYGLTNGDYVGLGRYSPIPVESQGFYLAAIVIGVERGWITREEGRRRAVTALSTLKKLKHIRGFYYHFIDPKTGRRGWNDAHGVELSNASAGTMIMGALIAGEYFGGEVSERAEELYARMDWEWFTNPKTKHPYLACFPEDKPPKEPHGGMNEEGFFGGWAAYSEHLFLYILSAGAPNSDFATGADSYYAMITYKGRYQGEEFIFCGTGAAFTYQWTHCFVDFRNIEDRLGRNWFENSRHAAVAARQYAIDRASEIKGLGPNSWGLSACMSPSTFYSGRYGSKPIGAGHKLLEDGTVAPYASSAFVVFTPKESIEALEHMYTIPGLVGKYGLYDAYSFMTKNDGDRPWIGKSYLGIDKGLVLLMFENYSTQLIWKLFHQSRHVQKGLAALESRPVAAGSGGGRGE